jgi:hypothetical protein
MDPKEPDDIARELAMLALGNTVKQEHGKRTIKNEKMSPKDAM